MAGRFAWEVAHDAVSVDVQEDVARVEKLLQNRNAGH